ncbi:10023_t:CDS:2, partial [Racocetra persica]
MSPISLICLVRGQPVTCAFVVDIDGNKYISHLKDAIKKKKSPEYKHIAADKLRLWKIEISDSHDEEIANYSLNSQDELYATKTVSSKNSKKRKESTSQKTASNKKQNKVASPKEVAQPKTTSNTKQNEKSTTASNKKRKEVSPPETEPNSKREKLTSPVTPAKNNNKQGVTETQTGTPQDARLRRLDSILSDLLADVMEDVRMNEDTFTVVPESLNELCQQMENPENRTNLYYFKLGKALQNRLEDLIEKKHKNARELLNTEVSGHFTAGIDFKKEISKAQKVYEIFNDIGEDRIHRVRATPTTISSLTKDDLFHKLWATVKQLPTSTIPEFNENK